MSRVLLQALFSNPLTWLGIIIMVIVNIIFIVWFQPNLLILIFLIISDFISFGFWSTSIIKSEYFTMRVGKTFSRINMEDLTSILQKCLPDFKQKVNDCIKLIYLIVKEFETKMHLDELDSLMDNLFLLSKNNSSLYQNYLQFGTKEQKDKMMQKISDQLKYLNTTYSMLQEFSGNLALLEANSTEVSSAASKLKYINQSLQDLITE